MRDRERLPSLETVSSRKWNQYLIDTVLGVSSALCVTLIIYWLDLYPRVSNISLVYLLIVLGLSSKRSLYSSIIASIVAFFAFDYFLVPPLYQLVISNPQEWLNLIIFLITAVITSQLASALRARAEQSNRREQETRILYDLMQQTNKDLEIETQLRVAANAVVDVFASLGVKESVILLPAQRNTFTLYTDVQHNSAVKPLTPDEEATAQWVMRQGQAVEYHAEDLLDKRGEGKYAPRVVLRDTASRSISRKYQALVPLQTGTRIVGVMRLSIEDDPRLFYSANQLVSQQGKPNVGTAFFWTFLGQIAIIIEQARLRREELQIELWKRTDELRAALLSSVSHDLRTPLASIKASASSLLQDDIQWSEEEKQSFAQTIERQADRLNRLVANLLDMSRIEGGALKPEKEWYLPNELVYDVLNRMKLQLQGREVKAEVEEDLPPVELDYLEIDQVLTNLIENALRYTPPESPIEVRMQRQAGEQSLLVGVEDRGPGVPEEDLERIFDKFYRVSDTPRRVAKVIGSGLGLAVCRGIIEAHGGKIWAENRSGGGAAFTFTLPIDEQEGKVV